jgi:hypothetical protein
MAIAVYNMLDEFQGGLIDSFRRFLDEDSPVFKFQ